MIKAQTENQNSEVQFESLFRAGLGLPTKTVVTEHVKMLHEAIAEQQQKTERLLKQNNTYFLQAK